MEMKEMEQVELSNESNGKIVNFIIDRIMKKDYDFRDAHIIAGESIRPCDIAKVIKTFTCGYLKIVITTYIVYDDKLNGTLDAATLEFYNSNTDEKIFVIENCPHELDLMRIDDFNKLYDIAKERDINIKNEESRIINLLCKAIERK